MKGKMNIDIQTGANTDHTKKKKCYYLGPESIGSLALPSQGLSGNLQCKEMA